MKSLMRLLILVGIVLFFHSAQAKNYTFTGNGEWTLASNWLGGLTPWAGGLTASDTITITGTTSVGVGCTFNCPFGTIGGNQGTIIIEAGGSFTLQNWAQFVNQGRFIVNGTLITKTQLEMYPGSAIIVNGTLINQKWVDNGLGTITINNGAVFENQLSVNNRSNVIINSGGIFNNLPSAVFTNSGFTAPFTTLGTLTINTGGVFNNNGTAVLRAGNLTNQGTINNQATLTGIATITGSINNSGILAPGNSPGTYTVSGDYSATSAAIHNFEIGGTAAGAYDKLAVNGTVNLDGTLNVLLINGFNPSASHDIPIITGAVSGTFSTVNKPSKYSVVYGANGVLLRYNITLPADYLTLDVERQNGGAQLLWNVSNETGVVYYEVERSLDGVSFASIGKINASLARQYSLMDHQPTAKRFYRVKTTKNDRSFSYSAVVSFQNGKSAIALNVFPSPATNEITVQHAGASNGSKISVTSVDGRVVQVINPAQGAQQTAIHIAAYKAGVYIIRYGDETKTVETIKFTKQ